jgi:hypothetical protein
MIFAVLTARQPTSIISFRSRISADPGSVRLSPRNRSAASTGRFLLARQLCTKQPIEFRLVIRGAGSSSRLLKNLL